MTAEQKLALMKDRFTRLSNNPKNIKAPGVTKKLKRQVRRLEASI